MTSSGVHIHIDQFRKGPAKAAYSVAVNSPATATRPTGITAICSGALGRLTGVVHDLHGQRHCRFRRLNRHTDDVGQLLTNRIVLGRPADAGLLLITHPTATLYELVD